MQRLQAFEVGILKGEAPNSLDATKGIVHRSPAIEHAHEKRIILRIDLWNEHPYILSLAI